MQIFFRKLPNLISKSAKNLLLTPNFCYKTLKDELTLTETCIKKLEEKTLKNKKMLRLTVDAGGLNIFIYNTIIQLNKIY